MRTTLRLALVGLACCLALCTACAQDVGKSSDRYALPQTDKPEELLKFISGIQHFRPNTPLESLDHRKKAAKAIYLAADRIMEVAKDQSSDAYRLALALTLPKKLSGLYLKSPAEQAEQYAEWKKLFEKATWGEADLSTATEITNALEEAGNLELAGQAFTDFAAMLAGKNSDEAKETRKLFEGSARRMKLPGQVLDLQGTLLSGKKLDLKSLRGKVVLVDFFATWCGPCLEEIPNLRKTYAEYKDRGFEIVSISIDEDRDALDGFMARAKLPWPIIHEKDNGGDHPVKEYYGIDGIPAMLLLDQEGKVVSLNARGAELRKLLRTLLPEKTAGAAQ